MFLERLIESSFAIAKDNSARKPKQLLGLMYSYAILPPNILL